MFRARGYTLIELMAVIVIMALAAGFMLPGAGVAVTDESARCRSIAARLLDLDHKARLLARSEGLVALDFDSESRTFSLSALDTGKRLTTLAVDRNTDVVLTVDDGELPLHFDRSGRSANYEVTVQCGAHASGFRIVGLTGLCLELDP